MVLVNLNSKEAASLERLVKATGDIRQWRRAQALLWLDEGESIEEVADRLRVTRQTVYNWVARFDDRAGLEVAARAADAMRSGRPRTAAGVIDPLINAVIDTDPRELGYGSTVWTAHRLRRYLDGAHHLSVCAKSVSRALSRLQIAWKRPRHTLALREPFWRQAKGG
jgi:transposase